MKTPKLTPIDLKNPKLHSRNDYLVHLDGRWAIGQFSKEWFGWSFTSESEVFSQLDGEDGSEWKAIYKIK